MTKKQTLEQKARELDIDESLTISEASRRIAKKLRANPATINNYLKARRKGFCSYGKMQLNNAGLPSIAELHDKYAKRRGYRSADDYRRTMRITEEYNGQTKQERFESQIELKSPHVLNIMATLNDTPQDSENIFQAINLLPERERWVISRRYFNFRTLRQIGDELGVSYQLIQDVESDGIKSLQEKLGLKNKEQEDEKERDVIYGPVEDGEILLVHILSKSKDFQMPRNYKIPRANIRKISDFINENYYGRRISNSKRIYRTRSSKIYKQRLSNLQAKYFPKPNQS